MTCGICEEPLTDDDPDGHQAMGGRAVAHVACLVRKVIGSVAHQSRQCSCFGGNSPERPAEMSFRESAIAAWKYFVEHSI
jgi:hypothetical protein